MVWQEVTPLLRGNIAVNSLGVPDLKSILERIVVRSVPITRYQSGDRQMKIFDRRIDPIFNPKKSYCFAYLEKNEFFWYF